MTWDLFISHASEDKNDVARPLADKLIEHGLKVWYDEYTLTVGDSLRRSIDRGLANSRYGLVILSPQFFEKEWTQKELDGLVAREDGSEKRILPVWHKVGRNDVVAFSPMLADKLGVSTSKGLNHVAQEIMRVFQVKTSVTSGAAKPKKKPPIQKRQQSSSSKKNKTTETWVMLDRFFFPARSVRHGQDGQFVVQIATGSAEDEADLQSLMPDKYGGRNSIPFAARNDAHLVWVKGCEKEMGGSRPVWTLTLAPEDSGFGNTGHESSVSVGGTSHSADDIAQMRAERILLADPAPKPADHRGFHADSLLESFITGASNRYPIQECAIRSVFVKFGKLRNWRELARLQAVFLLKASGTVQHILDLTIGPLKQGKVNIMFRGRRPPRYSNAESTEIKVDGKCLLK